MNKAITQEPNFVAETLAWCNERRAEKGQEALERLPKGQRHDGCSCPCGKACGFFVGAASYCLDGFPRRPIGPIPDEVREFVQQFDAGLLPQYDEEIEP